MSATPTENQASLDEAFPDISPGVEPLGSRVIVQVRLPRRRTKSGLILTDETMEADADQMQTAKVVGAGPLAFRNRDTGKEWPEGAWVKNGDFVRIPKYAGDRFHIPVKDALVPGERITFAIFNDLDLTARFTGNPLEHRAYL
jgi:co-chaperonin GroES (HSP10)